VRDGAHQAGSGRLLYRQGDRGSVGFVEMRERSSPVCQSRAVRVRSSGAESGGGSRADPPTSQGFQSSPVWDKSAHDSVSGRDHAIGAAGLASKPDESGSGWAFGATAPAPDRRPLGLLPCTTCGNGVEHGRVIAIVATEASHAAAVARCPQAKPSRLGSMWLVLMGRGRDAVAVRCPDRED
jgi:hypothetical protein